MSLGMDRSLLTLLPALFGQHPKLPIAPISLSPGFEYSILLELHCFLRPIQGTSIYLQSPIQSGTSGFEGSSPSVLSSTCTTFSGGRSLLYVLQVTRRRAFSVVVPLLWNSFHGDACLAPSLAAFRILVKTELFRWDFN